MQIKRKKFSIIISSCDKYSDLWLPLGNLYKKYWKNCNYDIYLITESLNFKEVTNLDINIKTININSIYWSQRLKLALKSKKIINKNVLLVLDDFFLQSKVIDNIIEKYFNNFIKFRMHMLRLVARPSPQKKNKFLNNIGKIENFEKYAISSQAAFWKKNILINQLNDKENIWQFEINGSQRLRNKNVNFYGVYKDIFPYKHHVIERGKWFPWYYMKFRNMKIGVSNKRETMNIFETAIWITKKIFIGYFKNLIKN